MSTSEGIDNIFGCLFVDWHRRERGQGVVQYLGLGWDQGKTHGRGERKHQGRGQYCVSKYSHRSR
jgi:hypothetical protein